MAEPKFRERDPKTAAAKAALRKTAEELEEAKKARAAKRALEKGIKDADADSKRKD